MISKHRQSEQHRVRKMGSHVQKQSECGEGCLSFFCSGFGHKDSTGDRQRAAGIYRNGRYGYDLPTEDYYQAIIDWMGNRHAWEIKKEWIICTPGVIAAFYSAIRAYTEPGDGVLYMGPVYYPFMKSIKNTKRRLINNSLVRNGDRYEIDFEGLADKAKDPNTKLMLFSNPHNPVGRVWTKAELAKVVDICAANDVVILADEIHHDLIMPGHVFTPMAAISEAAADICITATAASKSFNIAGLRNSNVIISNPKLHTAFKMDMEMTGIGGGTNVIGLKATEIAYTAAEDWLEEFKALIWHNHETLKISWRRNCRK